MPGMSTPSVSNNPETEGMTRLDSHTFTLIMTFSQFVRMQDRWKPRGIALGSKLAESVFENSRIFQIESICTILRYLNVRK